MRKLALLPLVALVAVVSVLGVLMSGPPSAQATLPPPCAWTPTPLPAGSPTPVPGTNSWRVWATYPTTAPVKANGVCITLTGTDNRNSSAVLGQNAIGCVGTAIPAVGAAGDKVSADWGTTTCVQPGDSVSIRFQSGPGPLGVGSVVWNCTGGAATPIPGTGWLGSAPGNIGGVAEVTEGTGEASATAQDSSSTPYAPIAAAGVAIVLAVGAGGWYARRRRLS